MSDETLRALERAAHASRDVVSVLRYAREAASAGGTGAQYRALAPFADSLEVRAELARVRVPRPASFLGRAGRVRWSRPMTARGTTHVAPIAVVAPVLEGSGPVSLEAHDPLTGAVRFRFPSSLRDRAWLVAEHVLLVAHDLRSGERAWESAIAADHVARAPDGALYVLAGEQLARWRWDDLGRPPSEAFWTTRTTWNSGLGAVPAGVLCHGEPHYTALHDARTGEPVWQGSHGGSYYGDEHGSLVVSSMGVEIVCRDAAGAKVWAGKSNLGIADGDRDRLVTGPGGVEVLDRRTGAVRKLVPRKGARELHFPLLARDGVFVGHKGGLSAYALDDRPVWNVDLTRLPAVPGSFPLTFLEGTLPGLVFATSAAGLVAIEIAP